MLENDGRGPRIPRHLRALQENDSIMKPGLVERLLNMSGDSFSWGEPLTNPIHIKIGWRHRPRLGEEQGLNRLCDKSEDPLLPPQSQVLCVFPAICTVTLEAFDPEMADYRNLRVKCGQGFFLFLSCCSPCFYVQRRIIFEAWWSWQYLA